MALSCTNKNRSTRSRAIVVVTAAWQRRAVFRQHDQ